MARFENLIGLSLPLILYLGCCSIWVIPEKPKHGDIFWLEETSDGFSRASFCFKHWSEHVVGLAGSGAWRKIPLFL